MPGCPITANFSTKSTDMVIRDPQDTRAVAYVEIADRPFFDDLNRNSSSHLSLPSLESKLQFAIAQSLLLTMCESSHDY